MIAAAAFAIVGAFAPLHSSGDECGWWRVRGLPVPQTPEFTDAAPSLRAFPAPGAVDMDLGLTNCLPVASWDRIKELARGLDHDPVKCYRYVRDNIAYASYFGILKGPERTLLDREGNELDQSFLLLALLRASGFPEAGIGYSPLTFSDDEQTVLSAHFRIPLRKLESGNDYNAADWLGVDASGTVSEVAERVRAMHGFALHSSLIVTEGDVPYLATDHFYVTLPATGGTYLMDPAFKPSASHPPVDAAVAAGYSRSALLSAADGTVASDYVQGLSKSGLAAYLDGCVSALRGAWTNENEAAGSFMGYSAIPPQPDDDDIYFHGTKYGGKKYLLVQDDVVKNYYRARATLKIGTANLATFFLDEIGARTLWISFQNTSTNYPKAVLHLDDSVIASESAGSSSAFALLTISISYKMGSSAHTYRLSRGTANVYAVPVGFGGDSPTGMRKVASEMLAERIAAGGASSIRTKALSLSVAGQQWISQVAMCSRLRSRSCGYRVYDYYNVGVAGYDGATFVDFGNRFGYFSNLTNEIEGDAFFSSALEHSALDQLNGVSCPSVSTVKIIDAANVAGTRLYFATSNSYSTAIANLTGYDNAVKSNILQRVMSGCSALLPQSGSISVNGWTGYGYAMQDHVNYVAGMFISGGRNGGYCTVNVAPAAVAYIERTGTVVACDASVAQPVSADPVVMPDGAYYEAVTDVSVPGGTPLNWTRHYDSRQRRHSGDLGFGWYHGFEASVAEVSDPDAFFGDGSVDAVLPTAVAGIVVNDMLNGAWGACSNGAMARRWTIAAMAAQWWVERTTGASVVVTLGARSMRFTRRPDGSYAASPGVTASLARTAGGTYVLSERHGRTYAFNAAGRLATITDPSGNVTTLTYSSGRLTRIENTFGARLSLSWAGGRITRVTYSAGRYVFYSYGSGRLATVNDLRGKVTRYAYDSDSNAISTKTDPLGNVLVRNAYNALGQVTNQVSDAGGTWTFGYCRGDASWDVAPDGGRRAQAFDAHGRIVRDTARVNGWTRLAYDGHGHVVCSSNKFGRVETCAWGADDLLLASDVNADGHGTAFAYDAQHRIAEVTNAVGGVTRFTYDDCHRVVLTLLPDGSSVSNEWTSAGLLAARTERAPDGSALRRTTWEYAASGLPVAKTVFGVGLPAAGVSESYAYDAVRRMVSRTDANGRVTSFTYDNAGNVLTETTPDGGVTSFVYDNAGRLVSSTDPLGRRTAFAWTPSGKPSSTTGPDGTTTTCLYDANDRLASVTDARGTTTMFAYDAAGRLLRQTDPAGTSSYVYNSAGLRGAATNVLGGITLTDYDKAYNPVVSSNMNGRVLWNTYDGMDRVVATSNALGKVRRFAYDPQGRKVSTVRPSGAVEASAYDPLGNLVACTNAEGRVFKMAYDALGRMTAATNVAGERVFAAEYDGAGNILSRTDGAGRATAFAYDPCNRLVSRTTADGVESFTYDLAGNLLSASNSIARETFAYDVRDRLTNAVTRVGANAFATSWARGAGGLVTNVAYGAGKAVRREYDAAGRLVSVRDWLGHAWTFSWNGFGQPAGGTSPDGTAHTFAYDAYGNLTAWNAGGIAGRTITRDAEGRRLTDTVTAGPMPAARLRRIAENKFDAADRLVSATAAYNGSRSPVHETFLYDGNGALTNAACAGGTVFASSCDAQGRLASLSTARGSGAPAASATFSYDALGNRIRAGGRLFVPDHSDPLKRPLVECDADGTPVRYYIWGAARLLGFIDAGRAGGPLSADTLTVVHSDEQGSVIALTDENGALLYRANYSPHGEDWGASGENPTPFAWLGGLGVMEMGMDGAGTTGVPPVASAFGRLYLTRHRLYSPVLRRFLSADPLGVEGGLNLYAYANGNPLAYVDPLGLCPTGSSLPGFVETIGGVMDEFVAGFVGGDFASEFGWAGTAGQIAGGVIPIYGQVADFRDTAANIKNVWDNPGSGEAWMGLAMSGVAWVPGVGDAAKGAYRTARITAEEVGRGAIKQFDNAARQGNSVLQTGGHTLKNSTLRRLGLSKEKGKQAIEAMKKDHLIPNNFHGKILLNGEVLDSAGKSIGNVYDYLP